MAIYQGNNKISGFNVNDKKVDTTPTKDSENLISSGAVYTTQKNLETKLDSKADLSHNHSISEITDLQTNLDSKANTDHTHTIANINSLQTILDGKSDTSHGHKIDDITNLGTVLDNKANSNHSHAISEIDSLQTTLDNKATKTHNHAISDVTNLQSTLNGKAASSHTHTIANINSLQTTLDGKASSSHTHTTSDISDRNTKLLVHGSLYNSETDNSSFLSAFTMYRTGDINLYTCNNTGHLKALKSGSGNVYPYGLLCLSRSSNASVLGMGGASVGYFKASYVTTMYGTLHSTSSDYAEMFEWSDGNTDNEDRRGLFVCYDLDNIENDKELKIKIANSINDDIIGVVSSNPTVTGDSDNGCEWLGKYKTDVFGSYIMNENPDSTPGDYESGVYYLSDDYDSNQTYISRMDRPEWSPIGLIGKLIMVDDGTCEVGKYCNTNEKGQATLSENKTRFLVIKRVDETHVKVFIK